MKALQQKQTSEQAKEQKKHTQDISRFKEESERILKETQSLLLEQFEKDKQAIRLEYETKINNLDSQIKSLEQTISSKDKEIEQLKEALSTVKSKLQDSNQQLDELQKQHKELKKSLDSATEKNNDYKKLLADTQVFLTNGSSLKIRKNTSSFACFVEFWNSEAYCIKRNSEAYCIWQSTKKDSNSCTNMLIKVFICFCSLVLQTRKNDL